VAKTVNTDQADVYRMTAEEVVAEFGSDPRRGLSGQGAGAHLQRYGPNELETEKPVPAWRRFLAQFQDVLIILLLVATAISIGLWTYERDTALPYEGLTIFAIVLLNGILGYVQADGEPGHRDRAGAARGATGFLCIGKGAAPWFCLRRSAQGTRGCLCRFPSTKSEARRQEFPRRNHLETEGAQNGKGQSCWTWPCSRVHPPRVPAIKTRKGAPSRTSQGGSSIRRID
jgi:hypothetical protein